jgi:hypothetical protein
MLLGAQRGEAVCRSGPRQGDTRSCDADRFFSTPSDWHDGRPDVSRAIVEQLDHSIQLLEGLL